MQHIGKGMASVQVPTASCRVCLCPKSYSQVEPSQDLTISHIQLLNPSHRWSVVDGKFLVVLVKLAGSYLVLATGLHGGQVKALARTTQVNSTLSRQRDLTLAYEDLLCGPLLWNKPGRGALYCSHGVVADKKRKRSALRWGEDNVRRNGMRGVTDQRTCPHNVAES